MKHYGKTPMVDGFFSHSGVLGQKWGVRRYQNPDGTYTAEGKARKRAYRQASKNKNEKIDERIKGIKEYFQNRRLRAMSDTELTEYINRLNLEMRAKDLEYNLQYKYTNRYNPGGTKKRNENNNGKKTKFSDSGNPAIRFVAKFVNKSVDTIADRVARFFADDIIEDPGKKKKDDDD